MRALWRRTTVRALGGKDATTHAPLRSRRTPAISVYRVRIRGNGDSPTSPRKDTRLLAIACKRLFDSDAGRDSAHGWAPFLGLPGATNSTAPGYANRRSADDLVRLEENHGRQRQPEGLGRLEVHDKLEPRRLLDGQVGGLRALEDLVHVRGDALIDFSYHRAVSQQPP